MDEAAWLRQHGTFGAKMVVLVLNYEDLRQPANSSGVLDTNPTFPTRAPMSALSEIYGRYLVPRLTSASTVDPGSTGDVRDNPAATSAAFQAFVDLIDTARAGRANVIVVYHRGTRKMSPAQIAAERMFLDRAGQLAIPVIRTTLFQAPASASLFQDQIHPTPAGYADMAAQASPVLNSECSRLLGGAVKASYVAKAS